MNGCIDKAEVKEMYVIYGVRCKNTKRMYIGQSKRLYDRLKTHFRELQNNQKIGHSINTNVGEFVPTNWQEDYNKYGQDGFEVYVLDYAVLPNEASKKEAFYIDLYRTAQKEYGYNKHSERNKLALDIKIDTLPAIGDRQFLEKASDIDIVVTELDAWVDSFLDLSEQIKLNAAYDAPVFHLMRIVEDLKQKTNGLFDIKPKIEEE